MSASIRSKANNGIQEQQEMLRNVTTTIEQQPPNKFISNTKKVSEKPQTASNTRINTICYERVESNKKEAKKSLAKNSIAKHFSMLKGQQEILESNNMESTRSLQLLEDFSKKKEERDQEIKEIQEMLNKIKSPQKYLEQSSQDSPKDTNTEDSPKNEDTTNLKDENREDSKKEEKKHPFFGRSKTELQLNVKTTESTNFRLTRNDTSRSCSAGAGANKPRSKSSQLPFSAKETQTKKKLSYNPEEARRYMEMQRKQRKVNLFKDPYIKSKIEKEEIKKRLEELNKNTRKLVFKNIQKKEKFMGKNLTNGVTEVKILTAPIAETQQDVKVPKKDTTELSKEFQAIKLQGRVSSRNSRTDNNKKRYITQEVSHRSSQSLNYDMKRSVSPLIENHKRVGLLRKTENDKGFSLTSQRNYNFDKENQNLEMLRKKLVNPLEKSTKRDKSNTPTKELKEKQLKNSGKDVSQDGLGDDPKGNKQSDLDVPITCLKTGINEKNNKMSNNSESTQKEAPRPNELPYWLKPSAAQVYPYNFIMAVRRKLEAIAQPIKEHEQIDGRKNQETSTTSLNKQLYKKRKSLELLDEKQSKKIKIIQENPIGFRGKVVGNNKELSVIHRTTFNQLKPLPHNIKNNKCDIRETENVQKDRLEILKTTPIFSEDKQTSMILFKYVHNCKKGLDFHETESFRQLPDMQTSKTLQKSLKVLNSDQEDLKQNSQQIKLPTNYKSMESLNSEINSNISSISLQMPISNTLTEVSSLRTESRRSYTHSIKQLPTQSEDEVTSLSSQNFSSEKKLAETQKDFEFVKPRPVSPLSLEKVDKLKIKRKESNKTEDYDRAMDFSQLLEDFNRSLSQVIQVNEQLKCTLDKSQQILSPHSSKKSSDADKNYSSDFEKSTTKMNSKENDRLQESLQKNNENLKHRKQQLYEMAEKVKPLVNLQKSKRSEGHKTFSTGIEKQPFGDLNSSLKSTGISVATTEDEKHQNPQFKVEDGKQTKERLCEIESLRKSLKQTLLISKEKRKKQVQEVARSKDNSPSQCEGILLNENKIEIETKSSNNASEMPNQIEIYCGDYTHARKHSSSNKDIFKNPSDEYKVNEKYKQQYNNSIKRGNNENVITSDSENGLQSQAINSNVLQENKDRNKNEIADSLTNSSISNSNKFFTHKKKLNDVKTDNGTQSEVDSTTHTKETTKSQSISSKAIISDAVISSSITEELQKTYESESHDNENLPLNSKIKTKAINKSNEHDDYAHFIKSHINRSRGDFQENFSKEAEINDTKFQKAFEAAASQISSTEFAQSADDEITSSAASKAYPPSAMTSSSMYFKQLVSTTSPAKTNRRISLGNEIVKFFSQYDVERVERHALIHDTMSESSLNYSNLGLYDKLIQNETNKSKHLTALLKMREKALLDRTKGQIAWLEVQKARYKAKGLINHIAAIKKKQRGILLKMDKEREEIKRLLYSATSNSKAAAGPNAKSEIPKTISQHSTPTKHKRERLSTTTRPLIKTKILGQQQTIKTDIAPSASNILRATHELESSQAVEELLKKRENDLRKRREHVERLMQWHQRLDEEEAEVLSLERKLLRYSNAPAHMVVQKQKNLATSAFSEISEISQTKHESAPGQVSSNKTLETKRATRARKMEKRLKEIDKSLKELSHISASSTTSVVMGQTNNENEDSMSSVATQEIDFVCTTGLKLNKLWKRLTSQQVEKFEQSRRYKLCKSDLERLYEEAKMAVLRDFAEDEERIAKELLEKTVSNLGSTTSPTVQVDLSASTGDSKLTEVPMLNLNFSSGHSEAEEESANNSQANVTQQGNYSPSVAEQNFKAQVFLNTSASSETSSGHQMPVEVKQTRRVENNVQMFLALSQRIQVEGSGKRVGGKERLQRSLSDTEISEVPKFKANKTTTSPKTISTITSHSNSSFATDSSIRSVAESEKHQRSKSSIAEMTYIPLTPIQANHTDLSRTPTHHQTDDHQENKRNEIGKDLEIFNQPTIRSSVICSVGTVTPTKSSAQTSSDIATIIDDSKSSAKSNTKDSTVTQDLKQTLTYSGQIGTDSETKVKEISSKLEEISAAVSKLSQMNALPSYESVAHAHSKQKSLDEPTLTTIDESILSTDASSSYSFNFDNITTDKHSSPGTSSFHTYSSENEALASKTYTKEDNRDIDQDNRQSSPTTPLPTHSGTSNSLNSTKSKTFIKNDAEKSSQTLTQSMLEDHILDTYEADFESDLSNVTRIEDITIPNFETTADMSQDEEDENISSKPMSKVQGKDKIPNRTSNAGAKVDMEELKVFKLLPSPDSEKSLPATDFKLRAHSPAEKLLAAPPPLPPPPPPPPSALALASASTSTAATSNQTVGSNHLMPDIINELEVRRHQLILDNEHIKQYEHVTAVPYMYVREIPNKPPPPYVPPAHGSPMTTIFPSEDRIKDITYRRTQELYCELLKTEYCNEKGEKLPSVMKEQITNIYERIILDICREYLEEHGEILQDGDPLNFHSQLAFFNPPNRLRCIQDAIYKEVRTCLAMDKIQPKRTQIYSIYGQRAKQDHIGKIIIQEMYDEDDRWCNFHSEESEVLHLMVEEMVNKNIIEIVKEVLLQEGGTIDEELEQLVEDEIIEENGFDKQAKETSQFEESTDELKRLQQTELQTSSVLMETLNEGDLTYCVTESTQENQTKGIDANHQECAKVNSNNITIQTCS